MRAQTHDSGAPHDGQHEYAIRFARTPAYHAFSAAKSSRIKIQFFPCGSPCDARCALKLELCATHTVYITYTHTVAPAQSTARETQTHVFETGCSTPLPARSCSALCLRAITKYALHSACFPECSFIHSRRTSV